MKYETFEDFKAANPPLNKYTGVLNSEAKEGKYYHQSEVDAMMEEIVKFIKKLPC